MFNKLKITLSFIIIITLILTCTSCKNANPSNKDSELSVAYEYVVEGAEAPETESGGGCGGFVTGGIFAAIATVGGALVCLKKKEN